MNYFIDILASKKNISVYKYGFCSKMNLIQIFKKDINHEKLRDDKMRIFFKKKLSEKNLSG